MEKDMRVLCILFGGGGVGAEKAPGIVGGWVLLLLFYILEAIQKYFR